MPQVLAVIGGTVAGTGRTWREIYDRLTQTRLGSEQSGRDGRGGGGSGALVPPALLVSLQVALDALSVLRFYYVDLAVFPEGVPIPVHILVDLLVHDGHSITE